MSQHFTKHASGQIGYTAKDGTRVLMTKSACDQTFGKKFVEGAIEAAKNTGKKKS